MMSKLNRRNFLQASTTALAAGLSPMNAALGQNIVSSPLASLRPDNPAETIPPLQANEGKKPLRLGLIIGIGKQCDIAAVQTHCGFIPENPNDPVYKETIGALREVVGYCKNNGQNFRYETGQETPLTLVRAIQDVGFDNQGVNFDLANLILYGKANPVDAIEILAPHVQGIHAKDGLWPTNPRELGREVPIGQGKVDFPRIIARLK